MSFPDPTAPPPHPYPFISPPFSGDPSFWMRNDQQLHHPDLMQQFDHSHPFKKARSSERSPNLPPFPSVNPRINPPGNKGTSHIFYKTRLCTKFKEGTCRNGDNCTFAHGEDDLLRPPPNWQDLIREREKEERGSEGGGWGDDQRMIHRMKICKKYYNGEECPYGDKCNFLHERPSPPMKKLKVDIPGQRESSAISIGTTGDLRAGSGDLEQTTFWKTRLCSKWEMGQCPFGERCHFAHGQSDLRFLGAVEEAELLVNGGPPPRKTASVSAFTTPPVVAAPLNEDGEEKAKSKWKLTKKINRIYADWLDDRSPPRFSPEKEDA